MIKNYGREVQISSDEIQKRDASAYEEVKDYIYDIINCAYFIHDKMLTLKSSDCQFAKMWDIRGFSEDDLGRQYVSDWISISYYDELDPTYEHIAKKIMDLFPELFSKDDWYPSNDDTIQFKGELEDFSDETSKHEILGYEDIKEPFVLSFSKE